MKRFCLFSVALAAVLLVALDSQAAVRVRAGGVNVAVGGSFNRGFFGRGFHNNFFNRGFYGRSFYGGSLYGGNAAFYAPSYAPAFVGAPFVQAEYVPPPPPPQVLLAPAPTFYGVTTYSVPLYGAGYGGCGVGAFAGGYGGCGGAAFRGFRGRFGY